MTACGMLGSSVQGLDLLTSRTPIVSKMAPMVSSSHGPLKMAALRALAAIFACEPANAYVYQGVAAESSSSVVVVGHCSCLFQRGEEFGGSQVVRGLPMCVRYPPPTTISHVPLIFSNSFFHSSA